MQVIREDWWKLHHVQYQLKIISRVFGFYTLMLIVFIWAPNRVNPNSLILCTLHSEIYMSIRDNINFNKYVSSDIIAMPYKYLNGID